MRNLILPSLLIFTLSGCTGYQLEQKSPSTASSCVGRTDLPASVANDFAPVENAPLLNSALGEANQGKLCQGQVFQSKADSQVVLFRAWNSTNPNSEFGNWWAFEKPAGKIAAYRSDYEICYQWSPLDKLVRCTLKPNVQVVVGNGQSAECSPYLTYPVSETQQIYIEDAASSVIDCTTFDGEFSWK